MENEYTQPSKFQRDWQGHYPLIFIYLTLVIACVIVGKETNWQFFGFMMYALLAVGILYLLCFLPWYFISLKEDGLSSGFKTSTRGISLILGLTCAFLLMFKTWGNWHLDGGPTPIVPLVTTTENDYENRTVYISSKGKYHESTCRYANENMQKMTACEAEDAGKEPGKCCHK